MSLVLRGTFLTRLQACVIAVGWSGSAFADATILNVSYDATRQFYAAVADAFASDWKQRTGETVSLRSSHSGSGKQARSVIEGLQADVVTLALESDINQIVETSGKINPDWRSRLPHNASPYTSTIVFLVREGNPKGIHDWGDLVNGDVSIITPNPKTSGGARWNYLAAWAWGHKEFGGDETQIRQYIGDLYGRVAILDTGARGATVTFAQRGQGDVLLAWENEARLAVEEFGEDTLDIITPPESIRAEPPVAVVDANVDKNGSRELAEAFLEFLYSETGQRLAAEYHYRPTIPDLVPEEALQSLPPVKLISIDDPIFGGWAKAQPTHFGDGGTFDQIYSAGQ